MPRGSDRGEWGSSVGPLGVEHELVGVVDQYGETGSWSTAAEGVADRWLQAGQAHGLPATNPLPDDGLDRARCAVGFKEELWGLRCDIEDLETHRIVWGLRHGRRGTRSGVPAVGTVAGATGRPVMSWMPSLGPCG